VPQASRRAPYTVSGTKNRLPREIERELVMIEDGPREALDSCYVEGIDYDAPIEVLAAFPASNEIAETEIHTPSEPLCNGGEKLPEELEPALALYARLVSEGERLPLASVERYLRDAELFVGRGDDNDDFAVVAARITRRGLAFHYAMERLHFILAGTEKAP